MPLACGVRCGSCGSCNGRRLRIYGSTDLPPSLPLLPGQPATRIRESSYRRLAGELAGQIVRSRMYLIAE